MPVAVPRIDPLGFLRGRVPDWVLDAASFILPTSPAEQLMPGMIAGPHFAAVRNMERLGRALERMGLLTMRVSPTPSTPDRYAIEFLFSKELPKGRHKLFPTAGRIFPTEHEPGRLMLQLFHGPGFQGLDDLIARNWERLKDFTPAQLVRWLQQANPREIQYIIDKPSELLRRLRYYYDEKYIEKLAKMLKQWKPKKP